MAEILVIEDDVTLHRVLTRLLERAGHTVRVAENGSLGIRAFQERRPDLVLTDIQMPHTNGIEVVLMLQAADPTLPVIAMSGRARAEAMDPLTDAQLLGAVDVLPKPFAPDELVAAVSAALMRVRHLDAGRRYLTGT
jgi:DNA-binding response OmpR family regulator